MVAENCEGETFNGTAKLTQGIHPEVVGIGACFGRWSRGEPLCRGKGIHFNSLIPHKMGWIDAMSGHIDACAPVKVRKA
jgi:hypothetical protein